MLKHWWRCNYCNELNHDSRKTCGFCGYGVRPRNFYDYSGYRRPLCSICGKRITLAQSWHADAHGYRHLACVTPPPPLLPPPPPPRLRRVAPPARPPLAPQALALGGGGTSLRPPARR